MESDLMHCYVWSSQIKDFWEIASELKANAIHVDVYIQGVEEKTAFPRHQKKNVAFPAHRLMLAAASPFLNKVLSEHYAEHHDTCVNVIVPNVSHKTLQYIMEFMYCGQINIPASNAKDVLEAARFLQIQSLINILDSRIKAHVTKSERKCRVVKWKESKSTIKVLPKSNEKNKRIVKLNVLSSDYQKKVVDRSTVSELVDKCIISPYGNAQPERSRRRIKSRYDCNIYELTLPKIRNISERESDVLLKKKKLSKEKCKENLLEKKEILHCELKPNHEDFCRSINDLHLMKIDKDDTEYEKEIMFPAEVKHVYDLGSTKINEIKAPLASLPLPTPSATSDMIPNLFATDNSYLRETNDLPCTSFVDSTASVSSLASLSRQQFSALTASGSSSSVISQISEMPVLSSPFTRDSLGNISDKYLPEICKDTGISNLPRNEEEEEEDGTEEDDGLFKLQVLLKDCEDFPESVTHRISDPLRCQNSNDVEVKLEDPGNQVDLSHWISEEIKKTSMILDKDNDEPASLKAGGTSSIGVAVKNECEIEDDPLSDIIEEDHKDMQKCQVCGKAFPDLQSCEQHHKKYHKEAKQMCKHCGKMFKRRCDLYVHERRHNAADLPCQICTKTFKLKKDLAAHMKTHTGGKLFTCTHCNKELTSFRNLRKHIACVHQKQKSHACHMCNKTYANSRALQVHIRSVHTGERPFKCKTCDKDFCNPCLLKTHEAAHTGEQKYSCKICHRRFNQYSNMMTHQRVHSNERPFVCFICKEGYKTKESLHKHKWIHTGLKPLRCPHCSKEYRIKESFERHMLKCHDEVVNLPQICFKISEKLAQGSYVNEPPCGMSKTILRSIDEDIEDIGEGMQLKSVHNSNSEVEDTADLAAALPESIVPVVQFVSEMSQSRNPEIELDANSTEELNLGSDSIHINYPVLTTPNETEANATTLNVSDGLSSGTDINNPIDSLLQVTLPGTHSSVIMTEDGKVNILLDC